MQRLIRAQQLLAASRHTCRHLHQNSRFCTRCLNPFLQLLSLECELEEVAYMRSHFFQPDLAHVDELRELVRSELPPSCRLDIDSEELEYPQSANWPDL